MRVSRLLTTTLRATPREGESANYDLLVRAGFIRQLTAGVYSFLPLGTRVLHKITQIIREEMNRIGGQEVLMPVLQPLDLWEKPPADGGPARAETVDVLFHVTDRRARRLVLGPTHEEVVTLLAKEFVRSYRDLPQRLYQVQVKVRDELRVRGGLLRTREFMMKDLYSFDANAEGLDASYRAVSSAYQAIFTRCGLRFIVVEADSGAIGGKDSQEFLALTDAGEDDALVCDSCGYAANRERAEFLRGEQPDEPAAALEEVYTPGCMSINDLAAFLHIPASKTIKAVCYSAGGRLILVVVRGDLEVNEVKLANALSQAGVRVTDLHLATPEELAGAKIIAGYTSPLNKSADLLILADISLRQGNNFVAGADRADYHRKNVNYPRDFRVDTWGDIASAYDGATCARCGGVLRLVRGSELAHIFKLDTRYSEPFEATYLDAEGMTRPLQMGCYGIGIGRVIGAVVEQNHDEKGLIWPPAIAPYHVMLLGLDLEKEEIRTTAEQLYTGLVAAGIEVLFDDRAESAGVKFNDADLLGLPLRVVVSKRSLKNGGVELKRRTQGESYIVSPSQAIQAIQEEINKSLYIR